MALMKPSLNAILKDFNKKIRQLEKLFDINTTEAATKNAEIEVLGAEVRELYKESGRALKVRDQLRILVGEETK